ncbi:MAG: MFS transporter [Actinomycetota bacterium]
MRRPTFDSRRLDTTEPAAIDVNLIGVIGIAVVWSMTLGAITQQLLPDLFDLQENDLGPLPWLLPTGTAVLIAAHLGFGFISDRTTSRFGRRRPWLAGGAVAAFFSLIVLSLVNGTVLLTAAWVLCHLSLGMMGGPLLALAADLTPKERRGFLSAGIGAAWVVGPVLGLGTTATISRQASPRVITLAIILLVIVLAITARLTDPPLKDHAPETKTSRQEARRRKRQSSGWALTPPLTWALLSRFSIFLGASLITTDLARYLRDEVNYGTAVGEDPAGGALTLTVISGITTLVMTVISGVWSDRQGRHVIFIVTGAALIAVAALLLAAVPSWATSIVAATFTGIGAGTCLAVSLALTLDALPQLGAHGRHLGLYAVAAFAPTAIAPIAIDLFAAEPGYPTLFKAAAGVCTCGGLLAMLAHRALPAPTRKSDAAITMGSAT